ncbi:MAG: hypothetical protein ACFBSC_06150 [Microcoleaceae cyanobacterium]
MNRPKLLPSSSSTSQIHQEFTGDFSPNTQLLATQSLTTQTVQQGLLWVNPLLQTWILTSVIGSVAAVSCVIVIYWRVRRLVQGQQQRIEHLRHKTLSTLNSATLDAQTVCEQLRSETLKLKLQQEKSAPHSVHPVGDAE